MAMPKLLMSSAISLELFQIKRERHKYPSSRGLHCGRDYISTKHIAIDFIIMTGTDEAISDDAYLFGIFA